MFQRFGIAIEQAKKPERPTKSLQSIGQSIVEVQVEG